MVTPVLAPKPRRIFASRARKLLREWGQGWRGYGWQKYFAELCDVKPALVSAWVNGTAQPSAHMREAIKHLTNGAVPRRSWWTSEDRAEYRETLARGAREGLPRD